MYGVGIINFVGLWLATFDLNYESKGWGDRDNGIAQGDGGLDGDFVAFVASLSVFIVDCMCSTAVSMVIS